MQSLADILPLLEKRGLLLIACYCVVSGWERVGLDGYHVRTEQPTLCFVSVQKLRASLGP